MTNEILHKIDTINIREEYDIQPVVRDFRKAIVEFATKKHELPTIFVAPLAGPFVRYRDSLEPSMSAIFKEWNFFQKLAFEISESLITATADPYSFSGLPQRLRKTRVVTEQVHDYLKKIFHRDYERFAFGTRHNNDHYTRRIVFLRTPFGIEILVYTNKNDSLSNNGGFIIPI